MVRATLLTGDAATVLATLPAGSVRCCVTSPPYWWLRDYGTSGQIGLEATPAEYVAALVAVFREVRRVLAEDGTLWLNLGDTYASVGGSGWQGKNGARADRRFTLVRDSTAMRTQSRTPGEGMKPKDLVGIPWRVAFALQADGWYLRSDIIWAKPNPMPESATDRPTKSHEYLFLLAKSERYHFDADAIAEPAGYGHEAKWDNGQNGHGGGVSHAGQGSSTRKFRSGNTKRLTGEERGRPGSHLGGSVPWEGVTRNVRSVWTIATQPYPEAHFATFPEELARRCIVAGSAPGDTVLDPFSGSGTVAAVAVGNGRSAIGIELNPAYQAMAERRIGPMFLAEGVC